MNHASHEDDPLSRDDADDEPTPVVVPWPQRAAEVGAETVDAETGARLLAAVWPSHRPAETLDAEACRRFADYLDFARVPPRQRLVNQGESGDFMVIVLEGGVRVERTSATGARVRLADAQPGDLLGEMALLDAGPRHSGCSTRTSCVLAVLQVEPLQRLMAEEPRLALALMATLSRRLSLRLRQLNARLSALLSEG